jgi:UDPglucose 6-dehydrogenase
MRVAVIGTGHVGLITCVSLAEVGHQVVGVDADEEKIRRLKDGVMPFFEPGVHELVRDNLETGRLCLTAETKEAVAGADVVFICVGTPPRASGEANLLAVEQAARGVARDATGPLVVAQKSTVPAGSADRLQRTLALERPDLASVIDVVSNPEFLREGRALRDALHPDRILVGAQDDRPREIMSELYRPFTERGARLIHTDIRSAELAKHASNAFLALKISYANALARIAEATDADVESITDVMGADPRIGPDFLGAGLGYGGYCFPKDLVAFEHLASSVGYDFGLLREVAKINEEAVHTLVAKVRDALWNLEGKRVVLLGLSFKPDTDDVRFSPALAVARRLLEAGAEVVGHDPQANGAARLEVPQLATEDNVYDAVRGAHCVVVCTAWSEYRDLNLEKLAELVEFRILVDGRNLFEPARVVSAGFQYQAMGRPPVLPGAA